MTSYSLGESLLLGLLAFVMLFWMAPGIQATVEKSRTAPADWSGLIMPLGFVILLVIFLIAMV